MKSELHPDPVEGVGHERRDISSRAVAIFLVALLVSMMACCVVGYALHKGYEYWMTRSMPVLSPMADFSYHPPKPHLQEDPSGEMQKFHDDQLPMVSSYGWINEERGVVRLPIERAKLLIFERGLPSRSESGQ